MHFVDMSKSGTGDGLCWCNIGTTRERALRGRTDLVSTGAEELGRLVAAGPRWRPGAVLLTAVLFTAADVLDRKLA